jgi:hypothetical protein
MLFSVILFSYKTNVRSQFKRGHGPLPTIKESFNQCDNNLSGFKSQTSIRTKTLFSKDYLLRGSLLPQIATVHSTDTPRPSTQDAKPVSITTPIKGRLMVTENIFCLHVLVISKVTLTSEGAEVNTGIL